jgi:hypothetical protein
MSVEPISNSQLFKKKGRGRSPKISLLKNRNSIPSGEPWIWQTMEMLESPAWRAMPPVARKIVDRVALEHLYHGCNENGLLPVTYDDFKKYGIRDGSQSFGISVAVALGWIDIAEPGHRGAADVRRAARYALTWVDRHDGVPRTNRWKRFQTLAEAKAVIAKVRRERSVAAEWRAVGRSMS